MSSERLKSSLARSRSSCELTAPWVRGPVRPSGSFAINCIAPLRFVSVYFNVHLLAPTPFRDRAGDALAWVETLSTKSNLTVGQLDLAKSEAIVLAAEVYAAVVLMDEQAGRQKAVRRGLKVAGTLSVLDEAEQAGLVNFDAAIAELQKTSFRV